MRRQMWTRCWTRWGARRVARRFQGYFPLGEVHILNSGVPPFYYVAVYANPADR